MKYLVLLSSLLFSLHSSGQQTIRYDLHVRDSMVNFTGNHSHAIAVNGQLMMPKLEFTEGDTAEIHVHNHRNEPTALHWHGLFLPNQEDGVPYLTQMPIPAGSSYTYRFPITQNGTYWYHSHFEMQQQIGLYGPIVLHKRKNDPTMRKGIDDIPSVSVLLSDWSDRHPHQIHRMLKTADDWFSVEKKSTQSYLEAIKEGHLKTKLTNEWKRMLAMDVSDVYYNKFLVNGQLTEQLSQFKAGDRVRLRIANAAASSYFWINYAGGKIEVVANDGNDVVPVLVDRLIIGVSETYDIIVTIPAKGISYELLATAEDRTNSTSLFVGAGKKQLQARLPKLKYFEGMKMMNNMMNMDGSMQDMGMKMSLQKMDMNAVMYPEINDSSEIVTLNYGMLKSPTKSTLPPGPTKELKFALTGNMNRYVWSMDNKVLSETDKIKIKKGENLRIILSNESMMRHPMHLHGHDFRVLNGQGDYAPLKNVLDIMPMETDTIEFHANVEGDWFFHCHILYHMMAGMGRIFTYEGQPANPLIPDPKAALKKLYADDKAWFFTAENDFASNGNDGNIQLENTRWNLNSTWRLGYNNSHGYEVETHFGRYFGNMQWLMPFVGFDYRYRRMGRHQVEKNLFGQKNSKDSRSLMSLGVAYTLPLLVTLQTEVYHDGTLRVQLSREDIPLSPRVRMGLMWNTDQEYMGELKYLIKRRMAIRAHYDSDMGAGLGLSLRY